MSSRKRRHGDSDPSGGDTDDGNRNTSGEGVAGGIYTSVGMDATSLVLGLRNKVKLGDVYVQYFQRGSKVLIQSAQRKNREDRKRERERKKNEEPEPPEQAAERLKVEEQKRKAEAAERLEVKRQAYIERTGNDISTEDFKLLEENGKQQMRQSGRSSTDANGQTRMDAFFPRRMGGGASPSSHSVDTVAERLHETLLQGNCEEREEPALASVTPTDEQTRVPEKMYIRLAFLRKQDIDTMKRTPAAKEIRKTKTIGPVLVEGLDGDPAVKVDSAQFQTLSDPDKRNGGVEIGAKTFKALKQALNDADWKVDRKYLSERNRAGENIAWTPAQVQIVIEAVLEVAVDGKPSYAKAVQYLNDKYGKHAGIDWKQINCNQVKYVYQNRDKLLGQSSSSKLGRPRLLEEECEKALQHFIQETLRGDTSYRVRYYMDEFRRIIKEHNQQAFYDTCKDPERHLRSLIRSGNGRPRATTTTGSKELSPEEKLQYTTDIFWRLAYLVQKYRLEKHDVYNFDETACRFHEDANGKVIARKGSKRVKGRTFLGSLDMKACCTFIPMVNCAGEKLDPAFIFKGTKGQTGAIPGSKDGFKDYQKLYDAEGERKVCFMQNSGKWSTNQTMAKWFQDHFIPQVQAAKEARRVAGDDVSDKYVVILDGVSTHCLSGEEGSSWIAQVQAKDPNLILLWLPPNMTGDLQPLDVNFNRPYKAEYRSVLGALKMKQSEEPQEEDQPERQKTPREESRAQRLKDVVIRAIIHAYNSVDTDQVEKGWTKAGKFVYEDSEVSGLQPGYLSAWDPQTQSDAIASFNAGTLFREGMSGGVSVVGGPQFVPRAGRKKQQGADEATGPAPDAMEESVQETATSSQEYSSYPSSQCPDEFVDSEDEEDEIIEALGACKLGEGDPSRT